MSTYGPTSFGVLPPILHPFDFQHHLHHYLLTRSYQQNWSVDSILHYPVSRPFGPIPAGEHHFEWRVPGNPYPVLTVSFIISPIFTTSFPITYSNTCRGIKCLYLLGNTIHPLLPNVIRNEILEVGAETDIDISPFEALLEDFLLAFYRPVSPLRNLPSPIESPLPSPLEVFYNPDTKTRSSEGCVGKYDVILDKGK
jgi:hypothetical protein